MNIAICDDDSISIEYLSSLCEDIDFIDSVVPYTSPETLLANIQAGSVFDILIMDIDFGAEKNGIDYTAELYITNPLIRIIYITGYTERFVQHIFLKESALVGFLTKPAQKDILVELLNKAQKELDCDKHVLVCSSGKGTSESIPCNTILFLESTGHKVFIHTETDTYSMYDRLSSVQKMLPSNFLQCHKSYLVNMDKIKRIDKLELILTNMDNIRISKSHSAKVKEQYFNYMQKTL